jgi:hypothetical protein
MHGSRHGVVISKRGHEAAEIATCIRKSFDGNIP